MFAPVAATHASSPASAPGRSATRVSRTSRRPDLGLVAACDRGEQARVDVAAREHGDGRAARGRLDLTAEQRGDADRAGALDHELGALHQQHHRLGGLVLPCQGHLVDPLLEQRRRQLTRRLDRDPVGDRQ